LLTNYGSVDVIFFDGPPEGLRELAWKTQPNIVVTRGAIQTPEQYVPGVPLDEPWEACITMGTAWQYQPQNESYKSGGQVINLLIETRAKGGNLLMNVGPKPDGELPIEQEERLREVALWMFVNGDAIYGVNDGLGAVFAGHGVDKFGSGDGVHRRREDVPGVAEDSHGLAQLEDLLEMVADVEKRDALLSQLPDAAEQPLHPGAVEPSCRLVEDHEPRSERQCAGDLDQLALLDGEAAGRRPHVDVHLPHPAVERDRLPAFVESGNRHDPCAVRVRHADFECRIAYRLHDLERQAKANGPAEERFAFTRSSGKA